MSNRKDKAPIWVRSTEPGGGLVDISRVMITRQEKEDISNTVLANQQADKDEILEIFKQRPDTCTVKARLAVGGAAANSIVDRACKYFRTPVPGSFQKANAKADAKKKTGGPSEGIDASTSSAKKRKARKRGAKETKD